MFCRVLSSPPQLSCKFDVCAVIVYDGLNAVIRILFTFPEATGLIYEFFCHAGCVYSIQCSHRKILIFIGNICVGALRSAG